MSTISFPKRSLKNTFTHVGGEYLFEFRRMTSGKRQFLNPDRIRMYQVDKEPWGYYACQKHPSPHWFCNRHTHDGVIRSQKPLFVQDADWKTSLSEQFNGLTGKALSTALLDEGYDLVLAYDRSGITEVCALDESKVFRYNPFQLFIPKEEEGVTTLLAAPDWRALDMEGTNKSVFVEPGRIMPVSTLEWAQDPDALLRLAKAANMDCIAVVQEVDDFQPGTDQVKPFSIIPLTTVPTYRFGSSLDFIMGYRNDRVPTIGVTLDDQSLGPENVSDLESKHSKTKGMSM